MLLSSARLLSVFIGVLTFDFLFWEEKMGLNTFIFSVLYLTALWLLFPDGRRSAGFWITAGGTLLTAGLVVWHNSGAAKLAHLLSAMCAAGFAQESTLRFVLYALGQYCRGWWQAPGHLLTALQTGSGIGAKSRRRLGRTVYTALLPLVVVSIFYGLYYFANEQFAALADAFWQQVGSLLRFDISIGHLLFIIFGFFLIGAAFWHNTSKLATADQMKSDALLRIRPPRTGKFLKPPAMLGLRQEYRQSLLLLVLLNVLLLTVNITDARYVWFGFDGAAPQNLKIYVHRGTYFLIASILLAMGVLFYIFRKNLHFFPNNRALRTAALLWLIQNAVLAFSVGIRNWRYIDFHGLAYKRIGVALFLALVFFGLVTLWLKISRQRTMAWLWRQNGWALYLLLVGNALLNWDVLITRYNLSSRPKATIDVHYLLYTVSDKNLYLLEEHAGVLAQKAMYPQLTEEGIASAIEQKRIRFDAGQPLLSWKSWNLADARNVRQ